MFLLLLELSIIASGACDVFFLRFFNGQTFSLACANICSILMVLGGHPC